ncbi:hypothetical protein LAT59_00890 [Candidatus Gracilibacteria bacterium]|nr:hypothetical protein [Candidatus Gracilibacteria bacterium]
MYKVEFEEGVYDYLTAYFTSFCRYYESLYEDSGLWNEDMIIDGYVREANLRKDDIIFSLEKYLSQDIILGRRTDSESIYRWRTKYIFITWIQEGNMRIVKHIEIR